MILAGFEHRPGVPCGPAALADAARVRGALHLGADGTDPAERPYFRSSTRFGGPGRPWLEVDAPPRPPALVR